MRHFDRIIGFVAVSFVLVFLGKVNKTELYTAYFKTIADVEVRNSTALEHGEAALAISSGTVGDQGAHGAAGGASADGAASFQIATVAPEAAPHAPVQAALPAFARRFRHAIAPRAPSAQASPACA